MDEAKWTQPVVIDNVSQSAPPFSSAVFCILNRDCKLVLQGSGFIKAGFAGEERPLSVFANKCDPCFCCTKLPLRRVVSLVPGRGAASAGRSTTRSCREPSATSSSARRWMNTVAS